MSDKKSSAPRPDSDGGERIDLDNPEFQKAWELLQYTSQSVFLTGKAGTGKSTFLRYITANLKKEKVVLAPTGIAAVNVGGQTMHSFFRLPHHPVLEDDPDFSRPLLKERMKYPAWLVKLIRKIELIIIDEISMVRADTIDFIDRLLRHYTGNHRLPFGGKQLLLVGDIFQLEPVVSADMRAILRLHYPDPFFFSAKAFASLRLVPIELRKIYRQNDPEFIGMLDRIRSCRVTPDDLARLNSRVVAEGSLPEAETRLTMTLATRRDMVDYINERHLGAIKRPEFTFMGVIENDFPDNSLPTDLELTLKEGAQVVFIKNDPDHRWVNGTLGTVTALAADRIEVTLENGNRHAIEKEIWANIRYNYDPSTRKITEQVLGTFKQYPVKLAWALTIHKSQGLTFNNVVIDLGRGAFAGGQTYVALSRCRSFEGLTLRSTVADRDIFVNPAIIRFAATFNSPELIGEALENAHADVCYSEALRLAGAGDLPAAFDRFIEATILRPHLTDPVLMRFARSKLAIASRLKARVEELTRELAGRDERMAQLAEEYCSMGYDCLQDEMPLPALSNFDKALSLSDRHAPSLSGRARTHTMLGDHASALNDLRILHDINPDDPEVLYLMASAHHSTGDNVNAIERCMAIEDIHRKGGTIPRRLHRKIHNLLADIYSDLGDHDESERQRGLGKQ